MSLQQHIGLRVRAARIRGCLTQEQLAERVGKTVETISNIERGQVLTGLETLERISQELEVPLRDFFEEAGDGRDVSPTRAKLEQELREIGVTLSDQQLSLAVALLRALANHEPKTL